MKIEPCQQAKKNGGRKPVLLLSLEKVRERVINGKSVTKTSEKGAKSFGQA